MPLDESSGAGHWQQLYAMRKSISLAGNPIGLWEGFSSIMAEERTSRVGHRTISQQTDVAVGQSGSCMRFDQWENIKPAIDVAKVLTIQGSCFFSVLKAQIHVVIGAYLSKSPAKPNGTLHLSSESLRLLLSETYADDLSLSCKEVTIREWQHGIDQMIYHGVPAICEDNFRLGTFSVENESDQILRCCGAVNAH